jgi:DNA primase
VEATCKLWEDHLRHHPDRQRALDELASLGIDPDGETVKAFRIGYAPPEIDGEHAAVRDRLIFPVIDEEGQVVAFIGRALPPRSTQEGKKAAVVPKYARSPESAIVIFQRGRTFFGLWQAKEAIRLQGHVVMVEANIDVLRSYEKGHRNIVAPLGATFTTGHSRLIAKYTDKVTLAFEDDGAGREASEVAATVCRAEGLEVRG